MTLPLVAIVGRPNVGKSTLFNRLVGEKLAIVHDAPGVTRDRHYADAVVLGREVVIVDTGGFDPTSDDPMGQGIARHVHAAIEEADAVVCVLDGRNPPTEADAEAVRLLRESSKPVVYVANRIDGPNQELEASDLYSLGIESFIAVSALHGRRFGELQEALAQALPSPPAAAQEVADEDVVRVALLGRPNAGKSSLFNRLTGSERALVDHRPGTTRDPIDSPIEILGRRAVLVDTAGIRRKSKVREEVEGASVMRALRSIGRADIIVLMVDSTEGLAEQDQRLLGLAVDRGKALVVGLNKVDLLDPKQREQAVAQARDKLHFAGWAPIVGLSAKTGKGVAKLLERVVEASDEHRRRIATSELNRFFEGVLERRPPPTSGGKAPRLYYVTQPQTRPPTFVAMSNAPEAIGDGYKRFVINQIRKTFGFASVPVRLHFRKRKGRE